MVDYKFLDIDKDEYSIEIQPRKKEFLDIVKDEDRIEIKPRNKTKRLTSNIQFVADGFVYHNNVVHGNPPLR